MTADRGPRQITEKRQIAMYLAREVIGASYPLIAACFDKDHSTVIYGHDAVASNPRLKAAAAEVRARLAS
jgi:chromosomal replication initiation ATPase DnaA